MALEPRIALQQLVAALERHLEAVISRRGVDDPAVEQAYLRVEDAFLSYEESLADNYDEYLPIELSEEDS